MRGWHNSLSARTDRLAFKWRMREAFRSQTGKAYLPPVSQPAADRAGDNNAESAASKLPVAASPTAAGHFPLPPRRNAEP